MFGEKIAHDFALQEADFEEILDSIDWDINSYPQFTISILKNPNIGTKTIKKIVEQIFSRIENNKQILPTVLQDLLSSCLNHNNWTDEKLDFASSSSLNDNQYAQLLKLNPTYIKYISDENIIILIRLAHKEKNNKLRNQVVRHALTRESTAILKEIAEIIIECPEDIQEQFLTLKVLE